MPHARSTPDRRLYNLQAQVAPGRMGRVGTACHADYLMFASQPCWGAAWVAYGLRLRIVFVLRRHRARMRALRLVGGTSVRSVNTADQRPRRRRAALWARRAPALLSRFAPAWRAPRPPSGRGEASRSRLRRNTNDTSRSRRAVAQRAEVARRRRPSYELTGPPRGWIFAR